MSTLWAELDDHSRRVKSWRSACQECSEVLTEQSRQYCEGPLVSLELMKGIERNGGDPSKFFVS